MKFFLILLNILIFSDAFCSSVGPNVCGPNEVFVPTGPQSFTCRRTVSMYDNCVYCQQQRTWQKFSPYQVDPWMNYQQPWWAMYGQYNYPNFNYPGMWANRGIQGDYYPGQGQVHFYKPNVYVNGKMGHKFNLKLVLSKTANFLSSSPAYRSGWSGEILSDQKIKIGETNYPYFFYDFRGEKDVFQWGNGYCVAKDNLVSSMLNILESQGFKGRELGDFNEHWSVKIPNFPYFCVYRQNNKELERVVNYLVSPKPKEIIRELFIVVPHRVEPIESKDQFPPLPRSWSKRKPASFAKEDFVIKEWGVGFLDVSVLKK